MVFRFYSSYMESHKVIIYLFIGLLFALYERVAKGKAMSIGEYLAYIFAWPLVPLIEILQIKL